MKLYAATLFAAATIKATSALSCNAVEDNLGAELSEGKQYTQEYPKLASVSDPRGYDDTIAFLVGGTYNAPNAAEIEGKCVVLGDFLIGSQGTNSIGKLIFYTKLRALCL